jgi:hypothetical protein
MFPSKDQLIASLTNRVKDIRSMAVSGLADNIWKNPAIVNGANVIRNTLKKTGEFVRNQPVFGPPTNSAEEAQLSWGKVQDYIKESAPKSGDAGGGTAMQQFAIPVTSITTEATPEQKQNPAQRNNNPGNLVFVGQEGAVEGDLKSDGVYWAKFPDQESGFQALINDTNAKIASNQGITLKQFIEKRSPRSENDLEKLVKNIATALGVKDTAKVVDIPEQSLARTIAQFEGFFEK